MTVLLMLLLLLAISMAWQNSPHAARRRIA
jgi:hypothetical protein